ncbi:MAG: hypothetical protein LBI78_05715 [Campylobacteraceae bacterium]|jgi:hypothetical protein|nr:hypothetical protein [Campylobacteraceae bacterium]
MLEIKLLYSLTPNILNGDLIYRKSEYSLDFIPNADSGIIYLDRKNFCSLSINTLQLEVDIEKRKILYPWGYFPLVNYVYRKINKPQSVYGNIYINSNEGLQHGVSYDISNPKSWKLFKDIDNGWVCISKNEDINDIKNNICIEFAKNSILCIKNNTANSLFMKPLLKE